ncbi:hypothetical protein Kpol_1059p8 [Vanderwaltozyma polyspora DSM 70294]|uniref:Uncharacterized protein n=1 Tax=Vanderwaltozyma polyspora (strain ATCC 22028 / DSM 70294 / BCRC 21397 / CBS 2163 / NBRC 10782 / NRRL Y-8283 / UCD 57-17) TaxID=436907 RepID=A7TN12_VANPO|nr:uncharacterized protein Kpol_1059p8 [Vanderwaltozyma polyspora DSM 70294]EDO16318.1 hypothetical protein Kpol_1059p8 [Vanderwaltozyma polyspora DSM 70294]
MFKSNWKYTINPKTFDDLDASEFKNKKRGTVCSYIFFVLILNFLKTALFISDVYTCIKLLAFNSWSNNIVQPYLPFRISKWLFSACILFSIVLLIWELIRGLRVFRTKNIALSYVNNFCQTYYSLKSYSTFCVFNKITADNRFQKIAFFTFFELKNCFRILFADTPRQVINGLTLWSVLITTSDGATLGDLETINGLLQKIKNIAQTNHAEAVILSLMLFSFVIWCIFITKLTVAMICSIFVYHELIMMNKFNGLREYVCVTVNIKIDELIERQSKLKDGEDIDSSINSINEFRFKTLEDIENMQALPPNLVKLDDDEQSLELQYYLRGKASKTEINQKNPDNRMSEILDYHDKHIGNEYTEDPVDDPLRVTSMIFDTSTNYFKDEIYTFDIKKHLFTHREYGWVEIIRFTKFNYQ